MTILVTGAAGFIGSQLCEWLLARGEEVTGVDNFNAYYDVALKNARTARLERHKHFRIVRLDVAESELFAALVAQMRPTCIIHLAAQAGVRYSLQNPFAYERSNIAGHLSVLEACRHAKGLGQLIFASSSSVYGDRTADGAFRETDRVDNPESLYAATKRSCELLSCAYSKLFDFHQTALRFFTVYGPWGRPDMAYFSFTQRIVAGEPIEVFGNGEMARDFTYVDDVISGILGLVDLHPNGAKNRTFNIGAGRPIGLMTMIETLERTIGREARKVFMPMAPGDVTATYADVSALHALTGYAPKVTLEEGLGRFVHWYRAFYGEGLGRSAAVEPRSRRHPIPA